MALLLEKQVEVGGKILKSTLLKAKDAIELKIIRAARDSRFATSAKIRDTLYKNIAAEYVALGGQMNDFITSRATNIARAWRKLAIDALPAKSYQQTWNQFDKKYLQDIIAKINPKEAKNLVAVNAQLGGMLTQDIRALRGSVIKVQRLAAASGLTGEATKRAMRDEVLSIKPAFQFIDAGGREWKANNYFDMLNRTVSAQVARESYMDVLSDAGYDLATIENGYAECSVCQEWNGKVVSISGDSEEYPSLDEAESDGVFHPNCMCSLAAYMPELTEAQTEEADKKVEKDEDIFAEKEGEIQIPREPMTAEEFNNLFGGD